MNKHCSNEVLSENRPKIQMQSWIIFERKIGKSHFSNLKWRPNDCKPRLNAAILKTKRSTELN